MTGWMAHAACAGHDPEQWFPGAGRSAAAQRAKAVCVACPVQPDCLAHALDVEGHYRYGIWGGMSPDDRAALSAAAKKPRTKVTSDTGKCGTPAGYLRHWRAGEPACYPCLDAAAAARRAREQARRRSCPLCGSVFPAHACHDARPA